MISNLTKRIISSMTKKNLNKITTSNLKFTFSKKSKSSSSQQEETEEEEIITEIDLELVELQFKEITSIYKETLSKLKFGTLTAETLAGLEVNAYHDTCTLHDVAQIIPKNDKTIFLNVYDQDILDNVKRALDISDLDLTITKSNNGLLVSLSNSNSKEAKENFVKNLKKLHADGLKDLRQIRGDEIKEVKNLEHFGKDVLYQAEKEIHEMYLEAAKEIEDGLKEKVDEVM